MTMKTVGRRAVNRSDLAGLQRMLRDVRGTTALVPRGVYRFRSFEEAETWMMRMMARTHVNRKSKISPASGKR